MSEYNSLIILVFLTKFNFKKKFTYFSRNTSSLSDIHEQKADGTAAVMALGNGLMQYWQPQLLNHFV